MKRKIIYFISVLIFFNLQINKVFAIAESSTFILSNEEVKSSKKVSKNCLKENIGQEIKNALDNCAELNKQLGQLQMELSDIQKNLFEKVEELIDNKHPFKKANKVDLTSSFNVMQKVKSELGSQVDVVKNLNQQINENKCLKKRQG